MFSPEFLLKLDNLLLSLINIIVLHELGHFIPAKLFGQELKNFIYSLM